MSYDLIFWREVTPTGMSPDVMMGLLQEDGPQPGVATWPIATIKASFRECFPELTDEGAELWWEGDGSSFNVGFGYADERHAKMFVVLCGYALLESPTTMNRIIDVGNWLGCALYDPQANTRYEQPESGRASDPH